MREVASFDHILKTYVGGHGKYQIINAIYMTLLGFASLPINFYVFTAYAPPHRCHVPKCETHNGTKVSKSRYLISYSFLKISYTVFPHIVSAETILF